MIDVDYWFNFLLVNYSKGARRAWKVHGAEGQMHRHRDWNIYYPHYKDMYPGGVKEMTALDLELSEEARAVKQDGSRKSLNDFWNCSLTLHPQRLAEFQAMCSLQFHTLNIPPQQRPMLRRKPPIAVVILYRSDSIFTEHQSWRSDRRQISLWISRIASLRQFAVLAHMAGRKKVCWTMVQCIRYSVSNISGFCMWLERLFIMKNGNQH